MRATERAFVTSQLRPSKMNSSEKIAPYQMSFLYRVRIEIILLYCELPLIYTLCCWVDVTIFSLRLHRRGLIHQNLHSIIMRESRYFIVKKNYFLNRNRKYRLFKTICELKYRLVGVRLFDLLRKHANVIFCNISRIRCKNLNFARSRGDP